MIQSQLIETQTGRCGYCNSSLVDQVIEWDHFEPFSYSNDNSRENWVISVGPLYATEERKTTFLGQRGL